ncbi:hypothetical protein L1987_19796 [Smallanthus sonchifolius]|uniref:Uncharacterized protein n=1 Tax=Smallanthus sonchifolius TaxID=185202 RepID=A0ACB9IQU1_9ASTR|nr:hypothetical protein L1987_19796 [Smallanthus sonchifolius]
MMTLLMTHIRAEVGMVAVNDVVLLRNHIPKILKKHFNGKAYYVNLLELFNEDDYLDTFGDPNVFGKENYGIKDPKRVAKIHLFHLSHFTQILPLN